MNHFTIFSFFFLFALLTNENLFSQQKIELLHANSLEYDESLGKNARRLIGNVQFKHEGVLMFCDSAHLFQNNSLNAFGNVRLQQGDSILLSGNLLKYDGNARKAELQQNVRLNNQDMTLSTGQLFYDMKTTVASYVNGGTLTSKQNTLTSKKGYYFSTTKMFSFRENVILANPEYQMQCDTLLYNPLKKIAYFPGPTNIKTRESIIYCEEGWYDTEKNLSKFSKNASIVSKGQTLKADSILYDEKAGIGKSYGNVNIIDTAENVLVSGDVALHTQNPERSLITGHALLKQFYETDTLFLHADTLVAENQDSVSRTFLAYHHVKFFKSDIQGKCDSLAYAYRDSTMRLYHEPVLWSDNNQLTAEKVELKIVNGEIKNLFLKNSAFIVSREDSSKFNQIKGKEMTGYFSANKLSKIWVEGNGQTIYFVKDKNQLIGVNRADCSNIFIHVKESKVHQVTFLTRPDAVLYPMSEFNPREFLLKDFVWKEMQRPLSVSDLFQ